MPENFRPARHTVVITGYDTMGPLGTNAEQMYEGVSNGKNGLRQIPEELYHERSGINVVAPIDGLDNEFVAQETGMERRDILWSHRSHQIFAISGARAMAMAGICNSNSMRVRDDDNLDLDRIGVSFGSGASGTNTFIEIEKELQEKDKPNNETIFQTLPERGGSIFSMASGAGGPLLTVDGACAAGSAAFVAGFKEVAHGYADIMIVGGAEAQINRQAVAMFSKLGALDKSENPEDASRPFNDTERGFVMAEGGGAFVLESLSSALRRGANIYGVVSGFGQNADAFNGKSKEVMMTGLGATKAMQLAAGMTGDSLGDVWIKAHATATGGDKIELSAIKNAFEISRIKGVSSFKGALGHEVGGSGIAEGVLALMALNRGVILPTIKLESPVEAAQGLYIPGETVETKYSTVIVCAYGFGGINVVFALQKYNPKLHGLYC